MITDSFDDKTEAIVTPGSFFGEREKLCDIAIVTFSRKIYERVLKKYPHAEIGELQAVNKLKTVHLIAVGENRYAFYLSEIGSALAATDVIEVNWKTGADKFIMFGSAGALNPETTDGKFVLPTEAYRDEGMSYHYAPSADYIKMRNADFLADVFSVNGIPYVKGRVWTTDAFYMETREKVRKRKAEGCLAVEMEAAGVQAVCDFYGWELYHFLATGDVVDQEEYSPEGLHEANHSPDKFYAAVRVAERLGKGSMGIQSNKEGGSSHDKNLLL